MHCLLKLKKVLILVFVLNNSLQFGLYLTQSDTASQNI